MSSAMSKPGAPTMTKIACHGLSAPTNGSVHARSFPAMSTTAPPKTLAKPAPRKIPIEKTDIAVDSRSGGKASLIIEYAGGVSPASPTDTPIRAASSAPNERAAPQSIVMTLHAATLHAMIARRLVRSARRPIGNPSAV